MKIENKKQILVALLSVVALVLTGGTLVLAQDDTAEDSISSSNYIYIEEFELSPGVIPNEAIAEAQDWVKGYRKTGEYKSVRLFIHNTGPRFALYLILEPNSWQSIEDGQAKFFEANPEMMDKPFNWGVHSDNLLGEIPVE
jgi:hypothetical protein